ncbi:MAG TPA: arabinofuranosyltransferase, partial [Ardenticatenaceae bacterium]|nr:arabinofuranosyltransferase [Ardenticatenaceae bacterium]
MKSVVAFGAALLGALLLCWLITRAPERVGERPWADLWLRLAQVVFVTALLALAALPLRHGWKYELAVALFSLFLTVVAFLPLKNTPFGLNGALHDQAYYTAAVTKFAAFRDNVDIIYKDLPSFYPPLYFYILGRLAAFSRVEPYLMIRYGLLMTT